MSKKYEEYEILDYWGPWDMSYVEAGAENQPPKVL